MSHTHRLTAWVTSLVLTALFQGLLINEVQAAKQLNASESAWVAEAKAELKEALTNPKLSEAERTSRVERSARTLKEYGQPAAFPSGDIPLTRNIQKAYDRSQKHFNDANALRQMLSGQLLDQQLKLVNTLQIEVAGEQIKLLIPGKPVIELSRDVVSTVFSWDIAEGFNQGKRGDANALARRFRQLAETKSLLRKVEELWEEERAKMKQLHQYREKAERLQEKLRMKYQASEASTFTQRGYEGASTDGSSSNASAPPSQPKAQRTQSPCTCEDWNRDGLYGVVIGKEILVANYGTPEECQRYAKTLAACRADSAPAKEKPKPSPSACTCEDWDRDGRYGVVYKGRVLAPNVGSPAACMSRAKTFSQCTGGR